MVDGLCLHMSSTCGARHTSCAAAEGAPKKGACRQKLLLLPSLGSACILKQRAAQCQSNEPSKAALPCKPLAPCLQADCPESPDEERSYHKVPAYEVSASSGACHSWSTVPLQLWATEQAMPL